MDYNRNEQALAFDRVLPWEGQVPPLAEKNGSFYLRIAAPNAGKVAFRIYEEEYLCEKDAQGVWSVPLPFSEGIHYVQLLVDDVEVLTPLLPIGYGYSRPYNYVTLDAGDVFYGIREVPHGTVRREYFPSAVTGEWESCVIYTPPGYEDAGGETFPVLYLQHGHGENETGWTGAGKVNFILDNLIAEKRAVPFAVVMCNGMVQTVENGRRIVDFRLLERQLTSEVIPFVEAKYHVGGCKAKRGMAGLSMGSLQTSITGFSNPELFSCLGIFSGFVTDMIQGSELDQVDRGPGDNAHLEFLRDRERVKAEFDVLFRAMGKDDLFFEYFKKDDAMLEDLGISHTRKLYEGGHDWNVWRMCIRDFAQMIFRGR